MLGGTGLKVSAVSFGFWATYGVKEGVDKCVEVMRICRKAGINLFDNAEAYGKENGDAELIMGEAYQRLLKEDPILWRRTDVCFTTKIFWGGKGVNEKGLSRKHVMEGMKHSLKRLEMDYVDVVFCHRFDRLTSTEEVVRAFSDLVRSGKALYWGTSEWSAAQITEAFWVAKTEGLVPPVAEQPQYNLFHRERFEKEYSWIYRNPYNMGTTIWSPLASGILTGKYNEGIPAGSRMGTESYEWLRKKFESDKDRQIEIVQKLQKYAEEKLKTTVTCLAIAWCLKNKNVSTVLLGATSEKQIIENLKSLEVARKMTKQNMKEIDELVGNKPQEEGGDWGRSIEKTIETD